MISLSERVETHIARISRDCGPLDGSRGMFSVWLLVGTGLLLFGYVLRLNPSTPEASGRRLPF